MFNFASRTFLCATLGLPLVLATAADAQARRIFVTSVAGPADFAQWPAALPGAVGAEAADSVCRNLAAQAGLANAEAFRAWLSTSLDDAWCRMQNLPGTRDDGCGGAPSPPGGGPWARTGDGTRWSGPLAALVDLEGPLLPLDRDETGATVPDLELYWTGTDESGRAVDRQPAALCADWTSSVASNTALGATFTTRVGWTIAYGGACGDHRRLACLETGVGARPPVASLGPAALAFVTAATGNGDLSSWPLAQGQSGVAAGDQICRREAAAAGLPQPQSFVAWLSSVAQGARDRLPVGLAWRRLDGAGVAAGDDDLADGRLAAPLNETSGADYLPLPPDWSTPVWTGTAWDGSPLPELTCGDWTTAGPEVSGLAGFANSVAADWTDGQPHGCDAPLPLYCFSTVEILFWGNFETGDSSDWSAGS